jgi:prolyl-tRNA editing enzyme YbaK/EbsC (Cys-tRNA(Pro) deacylase)
MIPQKVASVLDSYGLTALEFEEGSTPTAETAAARIGVAVGQIAKSILMRGKDGRYRLFLLPGDRRISSKKVKQLTGVKHSMSGAEETLEITGFYPGGVCPFGIDGVEIYLDKSLADYDTIYPAAGNDATGVPISYRQLLAITEGQECDVSA